MEFRLIIGMAAGVNYRQDMPPKGGYQTFRFSRHLPNRGPSGTIIMLGGAAVMAFGFYVIKKTNEERRCSLGYQRGSAV